MDTRSRTPYTILGCLTVEPMSGYDIKQFVDDCISHFWNESYGQIYPALGQLEEQGLVEGRTEPGERGRDKRVYRITDAGREELDSWLREPAEPGNVRYEHSLKLFFGYNAEPAVSLGHIRRLREQTEAALGEYEASEARLAEQAAAGPHSPAHHWLVVLRGGIRYSRMVLEWCDESEEAFRALEVEAAETEVGA